MLRVLANDWSTLCTLLIAVDLTKRRVKSKRNWRETYSVRERKYKAAAERKTGLWHNSSSAVGAISLLATYTYMLSILHDLYWTYAACIQIYAKYKEIYKPFR